MGGVNTPPIRFIMAKWIPKSKKRKREEKQAFDYRRTNDFTRLVRAVVTDMERRLIGKSGHIPAPPSVLIIKQQEDKQTKVIFRLMDMTPLAALNEIHAMCDDSCVGVILLWSIVLSKNPGRLWLHVEHRETTPKELFYTERKDGRTFEYDSSMEPMVRLMHLYNPGPFVEISGTPIEEIERGVIIPHGGRGTGPARSY